MRTIRIAAQLHPQHGDFPRLRAGAIEAEALGYDIAYTWDHFSPIYGDPKGEHLECFTLLAAWAEATNRIELGSLVACNSYRNPNLLADIARTIDRISAGRMILGVGSGWFRTDFDSYGYPFGSHGSRLRALGEALPTIRVRLSRLNPPPIRAMPLLIAGSGLRRTLPLVAQHADAWHAGFPDAPDELVPVVARLREACAEIGRSPEAIEWGVGVEPYDLDRFLDEDAERYLEMGFSQFTLGFNGPAWTVEKGARWMTWRDERNAVRSTPAAGVGAA